MIFSCIIFNFQGFRWCITLLFGCNLPSPHEDPPLLCIALTEPHIPVLCLKHSVVRGEVHHEERGTSGLLPGPYHHHSQRGPWLLLLLRGLRALPHHLRGPHEVRQRGLRYRDNVPPFQRLHLRIKNKSIKNIYLKNWLICLFSF